jgi:hypothetical protein
VISSALLPLLLAGAAIVLAGVAYLRREPDVRGRGALLGVRIVALALLGLLLWNPALPDDGPVRPADPARWVLLDAGPALDVPVPAGGTLRELVEARVSEEARRGARLALAGPEPEGVDTAALRGTGGRGPVEDFRSSLVRLAEAGADSILVLSPFRVTRGGLERALADLPVPVRIERVGEPVRNAGILELDLPRRIAADETLEGAVTLFGEGGAEGDSVTVEIEADGEVVETRRVPLPEPGARLRLALELPPPPDTGTVRYVARARLDGDLFTGDDERVRRVTVGPPEGGILLVSLTPDWEPRVLLPVLEAGTGLDGEGFLRMGGQDRWMPLGGGTDPAGTLGSGAFRERMAEAGLLVVHGVDAEAPGWLREAAEAHPRVIHLPAGAEGFRLAGVQAGGARAGEWAPDPELPPSPVAPFLSDLPLGELPPLTDARTLSPEPGIPVLRLRSALGGETATAVLLVEHPEGRRAVAPASGFWRWGNRAGAPREAYRGLWSGVAGWILAADRVAGAGDVRPLRSVVGRGEGFEWSAPDAAEGTLALRFVPAAEDTAAAEDPEGGAIERVVVLDGAGRGASAPLPPGRWRWEGRVEGEGPEGSGEVEVESWTGALALPPLDPLPEATEATGALRPVSEPVAGAGRPFRTHPLPYVLLLGLLCLEWVGRRRVGLR